MTHDVSMRQRRRVWKPCCSAPPIPRPEEVAQARAILAENAKGVGVVQGQMVDEAVARKARRVLIAAGELVPDNGSSH